MLALLIEGLSGQCTTEDLLAMDPTSISKHFDFDKLLPQGRLNGFENMIRLIQTQTKAALQRLYLEDESTNTNNSAESEHNSIVMDNRKDEVAVLLSGGVDSSVALKLLLLQGLKVRAYYLKIWLEDEIAHLNQCPWEEDLQYAERVCSQLGVPLETLSLQREYWDQVVQYTLREAKEGRTPNPDIMCNSRIKFGTFYEFVGRYHSRIATGHYAQVVTTSEGVRLVQSPDRHKDQSYFLSALTQQQLQRCVFPIGHLNKPQVRQLAEQFDLPTKIRKDSQGICFLGKLKFDDFIAHYLGTQAGPILCYSTGRELGQHRGLWFHTIGQRKGLGLLLKQCVHDGPWYVAAKNMQNNTLYVTNDINVITQPRLSFSVSAVNWIGGEPVELSNIPYSVDLLVKLRHGPSLVPAVVTKLPSGGDSSMYNVRLQNKDKGIAPGQFAAFYSLRKIHPDEGSEEGNGEEACEDDVNEVSECLGAGVIANTAKDSYLETLVENII
mmetsp:Transcript_14873/g.20370  ORF Transcript_14873/g.20370 Transcript_14873/m.20370 type:complete len:496 (-) Transcript_14873:13-1500(-)